MRLRLNRLSPIHAVITIQKAAIQTSRTQYKALCNWTQKLALFLHPQRSWCKRCYLLNHRNGKSQQHKATKLPQLHTRNNADPTVTRQIRRLTPPEQWTAWILSSAAKQKQTGVRWHTGHGHPKHRRTINNNLKTANSTDKDLPQVAGRSLCRWDEKDTA